MRDLLGSDVPRSLSELGGFLCHEHRIRRKLRSDRLWTLQYSDSHAEQSPRAPPAVPIPLCLCRCLRSWRHSLGEDGPSDRRQYCLATSIELLTDSATRYSLQKFLRRGPRLRGGLQSARAGGRLGRCRSVLQRLPLERAPALH